MPRYTASPPPGRRIVLKPIHDLPLARRVDILCRPEALHRTAVQQVVTALQRYAASTQMQVPAEDQSRRLWN